MKKHLLTRLGLSLHRFESQRWPLCNMGYQQQETQLSGLCFHMFIDSEKKL